jgi:hypothetical protein
MLALDMRDTAAAADGPEAWFVFFCWHQALNPR